MDRTLGLDSAQTHLQLSARYIDGDGDGGDGGEDGGDDDGDDGDDDGGGGGDDAKVLSNTMYLRFQSNNLEIVVVRPNLI